DVKPIVAGASVQHIRHGDLQIERIIPATSLERYRIELRGGAEAEKVISVGGAANSVASDAPEVSAGLDHVNLVAGVCSNHLRIARLKTVRSEDEFKSGAAIEVVIPVVGFFVHECVCRRDSTATIR